MGINSDGGLSHCLPLMVKGLETETADSRRVEVGDSITVSRAARIGSDWRAVASVPRYPPGIVIPLVDE